MGANTFVLVAQADSAAASGAAGRWFEPTRGHAAGRRAGGGETASVPVVEGRRKPPAPCGTQAAYRQGCKCEKCLAHHAKRLREWRAKRKRERQELGAGPSRLTGAA
jgi:hypothetical protein